MNKIAAMAIRTVAFVEVTKARLCFIACVYYRIASQLAGTMGELALPPIWTNSIKHEVFAKRTLQL